MASLLSVLFVVSSASGSRLLFSYPPNPVATPRVQRPLYGKSSAVKDVQSRSSQERSYAEEADYSSSSSSSDDEGQDQFGSRFIRGESSSSSSSEDEDDLHDEYDTRVLREKESFKVHLGLDTDVLGDLLCPRKSLCNRRFEMVINHLAFIAHPTSSRSSKHASGSRDVTRLRNYSPVVSDEEDELDPAGTSYSGRHREGRSKGPSPQQHMTSNERGRSGPSSAFSSRRASHSLAIRPPDAKTSRESSLNRAGGRPDLGLQQPGLHHSPSTASDPTQQRTTSRARQHAQSSLTMSFTHLPDSLPSGTSTTSSTTHPTPSSSSVPLPDLPQHTELESWAVVLVIDSPPEQHLSYHLGVYYRDVIVPLMAALKYEERRSGYVTKEAAKIAACREKAMESGMALTPHINQLCETSGLCGQLAELYHGLKNAGMANLTFNNDIDMSVLLHTEFFNDTLFDAAITGMGSKPFTPTSRAYGGSSDLVRQALSLKHRQMATPYDNHRLDLNKLTSHLTGGLLEGRVLHVDIAPWQTLLPLQEPEEMLRDVDEDGLLARFLEIMSPTLTFTEYETLLDTDSQSIIEIAEHLVYWRKARLIDVISLKCIYVPFRPTAAGQMKLLASWAAQFGAMFPDLPPLPRLLATLSTPQPFETLVISGHRLRSTYLEALTWLLQHELLTQLKVHMNLIATPDIKRAAYEKEEAKQKRKASSDVSVPEDEDGEGPDSEPRDSIEGTSGDARPEGRSTNDSNITISSRSSHTDAPASSNGEETVEHLSSATRSPLPRSFPRSYPYVSAASATLAAKPTASRLHNGKNAASMNGRERRAYLTSLNAPSLIANPSEPSAEEELWIKEMIHQVESEKGNNSTIAFERMLPYVDGSHHLDEILYRAALSRKAIRTALADYDGFLVSFIQ